MGFRLNEVVAHWYAYQAWPEPNFEATEEAIICCMEELLAKHAVALPGVIESLIEVKAQGFKIALASSSSMRFSQSSQNEVYSGSGTRKTKRSKVCNSRLYPKFYD
jgi:phosphoglycolate phosphatase-like HAD superfamily hydrolase